jgi:6-phosphogluconolactonase
MQNPKSEIRNPKSKMNRVFKIFPTPKDLAETFAADLIRRIKNSEKKRKPITIAISGGNTPKFLFSVLAEKSSSAVNWNMVKFFWVDERCVPPDDPESNFGMTDKIFLSKIKIVPENIHRIMGEADPVKEASRYSGVIKKNTRSKNNIPVFDIVILGMGDDGHTASIFSGNIKLLSSKKICDTVVHPVSLQRRITITGKVINNAEAIFFLVTGLKKANVVNEIFCNSANAGMFPASHINSVNGETTWLLDKEAGKYVI